MTAATPMIMPSAVSAVRMALRRSAFTAMDKVMMGDMFVIGSGVIRSGRFCQMTLDSFCVACCVVLEKFVGSLPALEHRSIESHAAVAEADDARRVLRDVRLVG